MQAGRVEGQQQTVHFDDEVIRDVLSDLGAELVHDRAGFRVPCFIPQCFRGQTVQELPLKQFCDRTLKHWPPKEGGQYLRDFQLIGQLGLLLSQGRVPDPQQLMEVLKTLDKASEHCATALIKCFVCQYIRVSIPAAQWEALDKSSLSGEVKRWAQVIFHPAGGEKEVDYVHCCHRLIAQQSSSSLYRDVFPQLMKYWAGQGVYRKYLLELLITVVVCSDVPCPWTKLFSMLHGADSFWSVWRDIYPGHFNDINSVMTSPLPDGRLFFVSLWQSSKDKCQGPLSHQGYISHMTNLSLGAECEQRYKLAALAGGDNRETLFSPQSTQRSISGIAPLIFTCMTKTLDCYQRIALLISLLKSGATGLRWRDLYDQSGRLNHLWLHVMPDEIKTMSDLLASRLGDYNLCFMDFWEQNRTDALDWLFKMSEHSGLVFLERVIFCLLVEKDNTGLHEVARYLEQEQLEKERLEKDHPEKTGAGKILLSDDCRHELFESILSYVKRSAGHEHTLGGGMRVLRVLAAGHEQNLSEVARLSEVAWQNIFGGNTPVPEHITTIILHKEEMFQEDLNDFKSYFPEQVSLLSLTGGLFGRLLYKGGKATIPENSVLYIDCHGIPGILASCPAGLMARRLYTKIKPRCHTLPNRIVLDSCFGARSKGGGSLSSAEIFARVWYQKTHKPVSVLAYEGVIYCGLLQPQREVHHYSTEAHKFRSRQTRELLVSVSAAGRMKKTWRTIPSRQYGHHHACRRLKFS